MIHIKLRTESPCWRPQIFPRATHNGCRATARVVGIWLRTSMSSGACHEPSPTSCSRVHAAQRMMWAVHSMRAGKKYDNMVTYTVAQTLRSLVPYAKFGGSHVGNRTGRVLEETVNNYKRWKHIFIRVSWGNLFLSGTEFLSLILTHLGGKITCHSFTQEFYWVHAMWSTLF